MENRSAANFVESFLGNISQRRNITDDEAFNAGTATNISNANRKYDWMDIFLLTAFSTVFIVGVIGNLLVCHFFRCTTTKQKTGTGRLIFYLAITDLLASIINPALYAYWQITNRRAWHFGIVGCKILPMLAKCSITISQGIILLITIERCIVISRPFQPHRYKGLYIHLALASIVCLSVACEIPLMVYSKISPGSTCGVQNLLVDWFFYPSIVVYTSRDIIFLVTFVTTTLLIYKELYNKEHLNTLKQQKDFAKNRKIVKLLIIIATVFTVLVFPREVLHIVYMMSWKFGEGIPFSDTLRNLNALLKVLHMCNSACNVFIYAGLHGKFQHKLLSLIYKLFGKEYTRSLSSSESQEDQQKRYFNNTTNHHATVIRTSASTPCMKPDSFYSDTNRSFLPVSVSNGCMSQPLNQRRENLGRNGWTSPGRLTERLLAENHQGNLDGNIVYTDESSNLLSPPLSYARHQRRLLNMNNNNNYNRFCTEQNSISLDPMDKSYNNKCKLHAASRQNRILRGCRQDHIRSVFLSEEPEDDFNQIPETVI